jgi:hypothetical protein
LDGLEPVDFRGQISNKILRFNRTRMTVGVDLYNVTNSSAILTYSNTFVPNGPWLLPNTVLTGRLARINAEFTFGAYGVGIRE